MSQSTGELEILGLISTQYASETHAARGPVIDKTYTAALALAHENGGFDRVLIGYNSASPDGFQVAAFAAARTSRLRFLLAHRPGFVAPTLAARQLATLDQFSDGRLAVHVITGGSDAEQQRDGDFLSKDERYERTDEYIGLLLRTWTEAAPFQHKGRYYEVEKGGFPPALQGAPRPRKGILPPARPAIGDFQTNLFRPTYADPGRIP